MVVIRFVDIVTVFNILSSLHHLSSFNLDYQHLNCSISWIIAVKHRRCVKVIGDSVPDCVYRELHKSNIRLIISNNLTGILTPTISEKIKRFKCRSYILMQKNAGELKMLFNGKNKFFYSFTKFFVIKSSEEMDEIFNKNEIEFIYSNALNVYTITMNSVEANDSDNALEFSEIKNILTGSILQLANASNKDLHDFYGTELSHPLLDLKNHYKELTVDVFNCSPHVIYNEHQDGNFSFDGIDYRVFHEVTKYWPIKWNVLKITPDGEDPYKLMVDHLNEAVSDVALCRLWMTLRHHTYTDLVITSDQSFVKLIAPLPTLIDDAAAIYSSLRFELWTAYTVCLIFLGILLTILDKIWRNKKRTDKSSLAKNYFYLINISTSQSIRNLPKKQYIRHILSSWMLVSLAVGTAYSTAYMSILATPKFSALVDTVEQFLEKGYHFGAMFNHTNFIDSLRESNDTNYLKLIERQVIFKNYTEMEEKLATGQYGVFAKVLRNNYLIDCEWAKDFAGALRIVNQPIFSYYMAFGLQKDSPYRRLFNNYQSRLTETGIISHWLLEIGDIYKTNYFNLFKHQEQRAPHRQQLTIKNLSGAFYVLIIGYFISFLVFFLELRKQTIYEKCICFRRK